MSRNEGEEQGKTGKILLEVFQMAMMQEQDAGERRRGEGKKAEGKVSCLGQGIQKLIFAPVNSWNF